MAIFQHSMLFVFLTTKRHTEGTKPQRKNILTLGLRIFAPKGLLRSEKNNQYYAQSKKLF